MKIPNVTDQMLDKVLESAASPILVLFKGMEELERSLLAVKNVQKVAESFDDKIIFLIIDADENPGPADLWAHGEVPLVLVFQKGRLIGRLDKSFSCEEIEQLVTEVLKK